MFPIIDIQTQIKNYKNILKQLGERNINNKLF